MQCSMRMFTLLAMLIIVMIPVLARSFTIEDEMTKSIESFENLDQSKKDSMIAVVKATFKKYPVSSSDKTRMAKDHLNVYLQDHIVGREDHSDRQFSVAVDTFAWALENYAKLPEITEDQRENGMAEFGTILTGIKAFIEDSYKDTPADVRQKLFDAVRDRLDANRPKVGNYFYPEFLCLSASGISQSEVIESISKTPFLRENAEKYAPIKTIKENPNLDENSKQVHDGFFVERESFKIINEAMRVASSAFQMTKEGYDKYIPFPAELRAREQSLHEELVAEANKIQEEFLDKRKHEEVLREIVGDGDLSVVSGAFADELFSNEELLTKRTAVVVEEKVETETHPAKGAQYADASKRVPVNSASKKVPFALIVAAGILLLIAIGLLIRFAWRRR